MKSCCALFVDQIYDESEPFTPAAISVMRPSDLRGKPLKYTPVPSQSVGRVVKL